MALQFPINPNLNQTYSSGSSATYTWNGSYWQTTLPPTQTILFATSASSAVTATSASFAEKSKLWYVNVTSTASYTLPAGYTADTCRYHTIADQTNGVGAWFNTGTYRFTPQKAGYWRITLGYDVYRNNEVYLNIFKNSNGVAGIGGLDLINGNVTKTVYVNGTTDYIYGSNNGNATGARTQVAAKSFFEATWIGE